MLLGPRPLITRLAFSDRVPKGPGEVAEGADAIGEEEVLQAAEPGNRADQINDVFDFDTGVTRVLDGLRAVASFRAQAHEQDNRIAEARR